MLRRRFAQAAAGGLSALPSGWSGDSRPDVVLAVSKGWSPAGAPQAARLAREGLAFARAYTVNPEPRAAVTALLTGMYPHAAGAGLTPLTSVLAAAGYTVRGEPSGIDPDQAVEWIHGNTSRPFFVLVTWDSNDPRSESGQPLGHLMAAVDRRQTARETLVVFTATHGQQAGEPLETSTRVPLILRYPREIPPGEPRDRPVSSVDVFPTVTSFCRVRAPGGLHGHALEGTRRETVFSYGRLGTREEWRMVVRGLHKLIVNARMEPVGFYNLGKDPNELENLAAEPSQQLLRDEMQAHLAVEMRRAGYTVDPSGLKPRD